MPEYTYIYQMDVVLTRKELRDLERTKKDLVFEHRMMHLDDTDTYKVFKRQKIA